MIFAAGRILELSIAAQIDPRMHAERLAEIAGAPDAGRRRAAEALLHFAERHPTAAHRTLNTIARLRGLRYVGSGIEYTVYRKRQPDEVIKVHRDSAETSDIERRNLICEKQADHALLREFLGSTVVAQTVETAPHVLGGYNVVLVRQPFIAFNEEDAVFEVGNPEVAAGRLDKIVRAHPGSVEGLYTFIDSSHRMLDRSNSLPDTNGKFNVVVAADGTPTLIDTTPIPMSEPNTSQLVLNQLQSLEIGLREVA